MTDVRTVDLDLMRYRSPVKMARAIGEETDWITPTKAARNALCSRFAGAERIEKYHISKESILPELKSLVEHGIRAAVVDVAAGKEWMLGSMAYYVESSNCNVKTLYAALEETFKLADIKKPPDVNCSSNSPEICQSAFSLSVSAPSSLEAVA